MSQPVYDFTEGYHEAVEASRDAGPGSDEAMERFKAFMVRLSPETVRAETLSVYAPNAYLNDNLNELRGAQAIQHHFAASLEGLSDISVEFHDTVRSGDDWYVRWSMSTTFKSLRDGATVLTSGMSHVRFDGEGRVLLHRDFWDSASGLYEHIPILGGAIRTVKSRFSEK